MALSFAKYQHQSSFGREISDRANFLLMVLYPVHERGRGQLQAAYFLFRYRHWVFGAVGGTRGVGAYNHGVARAIYSTSTTCLQFWKCFVVMHFALVVKVHAVYQIVKLCILGVHETECCSETRLGSLALN